mgnify:CR=1 FL=1
MLSMLLYLLAVMLLVQHYLMVNFYMTRCMLYNILWVPLTMVFMTL